jgi:hypothetical protein
LSVGVYLVVSTVVVSAIVVTVKALLTVDD